MQMHRKAEGTEQTKVVSEIQTETIICSVPGRGANEVVVPIVQK